MKPILLVTSETGLAELEGRRMPHGYRVNVLAVLRDASQRYSADIEVRLIHDFVPHKADRKHVSEIIVYGLTSGDCGGVIVRDLRSIIAPFHADGWPSEQSLRRNFDEFLVNLEKRENSREAIEASPGASAPSRPRSPSIIIAWDPEILSSADYALLVSSLGDMARDLGAGGIERVLSEPMVIGDPEGVIK